MKGTHQILSRLVTICLCAIWAISVACASNDKPVTVVSMVKLITDGEKYVGRQIRVFGYLALGSSLRIYLSKEHAEGGDSTSSIEVSDTNNGDIYSSDCVSSYVSITGTLVERDNVLGLSDVEEIFKRSSSGYCWRRGK